MMHTQFFNKDYVVHELVLRSLTTGAIRYIEWSHDDELEISLTEQKLSSADVRRRLKDDEGQEFSIDEDLDEVAEEAWPIRFDLKTYDYDDDWAFRFRSSDGRTHTGHLYEFGTEAQGWLTIEAWKDGKDWEYQVFLSSDVHPNQIQVLALGD